mmetsp:Transcript_25331/g.58214  ORF Transcript_25331/g.58214 Transcript_25331/m.58214 type:complete len:500 (+) Transcript_25331:38-1537(+)
MKKDTLVALPLLFFLHGRTILDEFQDEIVGYVVEVVQNFHSSIHKVGFVVLDAPFLAKGFHKLVRLGEVVSGQGREQMVVHLILKTTAEPIHKELREPVSSGNVTSGGHLKLPEIGPGLGIVRRHTIVSQSKHNGQEPTARASHGHEKGNGFANTKGSVSGGHGKGPDVVQDHANTFQRGVLEALELHFLCRIFGRGTQTKGNLEGFVHPGQAGEEENGKVKESLVANQKADHGRVLALIQFTVGLRLLQTPGQERHGIDIRISILTERTGTVQVGHGVVTIVLVLPPLHRVSLHEVSPKDSSPIPVLSLAKDLVVQEIVCQPTRLLEKETNQQGRRKVDGGIVRNVHGGHGGGPQGQCRNALVHIKELVGLEHAHGDEFGSQITVSLFKSNLLRILGQGFGHDIPNVKLFHQVLRSGRVKGGKNVRHVITGVRENDTATGMFVPVGDIVHLVVVDHPSIIGSHVFLDFVPSDFLVDAGLVAGGYGVSSFAHDATGCEG